METPAAIERRQGHLPLRPLLAFLFAAVVAIGLCASAVLKRRSGAGREGRAAAEGIRPPAGCASLKQALQGTVRWSSSRKLGGEWDSGRWEGLVDLPAEGAGGAGWCSPAETPAGAAAAAGAPPSSPLWQRRILMGERCELPRFSGLILYDERGFPLQYADGAACRGAGRRPSDQQDKAAMAVVTTLRDLL